MALSVNECLNKLQKLHSDLYPIWYIEDQGVYMVAMLKHGIPKNEAVLNLYAVDSRKGVVAGPISPFQIYNNEALTEKLQHPFMIEKQSTIRHIAAYPDYLIHYGIKGQKWGVRRFQNEDGSLTLEGKKRYGSGLTIKKSLIGNSEPQNSANTPQKKMSFSERGRLKQAMLADDIIKSWNIPTKDIIDRDETKQNKLDKMRLVENTALTIINPLNAINFAADGVGAGIARAKLNSYMKNREQKSDFDPKTGLYIKKEGSYNEKQDLAAVNPAYMNMNTNTKNNCMLCTTTYDLRKRGYDVTAQLDSEGYNFADLKRWYPKVKIENTTRYDENGRALKQKEYVEKTINNLLKQGDGARGNMMVFFNMGGGHSLAYEVQNGKVIFKDGQTNSSYKGTHGFFDTTPSAYVFLNSTLVNSYARLDNVKPDLEMIKKECVR